MPPNAPVNSNPDGFRSAIYRGWVRHRRITPRENSFKYSVFMMYLDTAEIDRVLALSPFWSRNWLSLARFKRADFHGDAQLSVDDAVRETVFKQTGKALNGPIRMLVNLRYFGYNMNPLSTYYCFDERGQNLEAIVAEVHNTPWGKRHAYALSVNSQASKQKFEFEKVFHVSPFNPIDMDYRWYSTTPSDQLTVHIENWRENNKVMDATMVLHREQISSAALNTILVRFPIMTVKVIVAIYWQALKLWLKKVPLYPYLVKERPVDKTPQFPRLHESEIPENNRL